MVSQLDLSSNFWRTPLCSWRFQSRVWYLTFSYGTPSCLRSLTVISTWAFLEVPSQSSQRSHILFLVHLLLQPRCPCGSLVIFSFIPWFTFKKGIRFFLGGCGCSALQLNCSRSLVDLYEITIFLGLFCASTLVLGFIPATLSYSDKKLSRDCPNLGFPSFRQTDFCAFVFPILLLRRIFQDKDNRGK